MFAFPPASMRPACQSAFWLFVFSIATVFNAQSAWQTEVLVQVANQTAPAIAIDVPADKYIEITSFLHNNQGSGQAGWIAFNGMDIVRSHSEPMQVTPSVNYSTSSQFSDKSIIFAGPGTVTIHAQPSNETQLLCTYQIKANSDTTVGISQPSNAVVIPSESNGPVQIILESSTDLVTWTAAQPGTYGASTTKRFFRVRAVAATP